MRHRTYFEVPGSDRSDLPGQVGAQRARVAERLAQVRHVVAVMSGKGGVGKSWVTTRIALAAARAGRSVGVVDADLRSPTVARMLEAAGPLDVGPDGVTPATGREGVRVMSTEFLLDEGRPLRWREPDREQFVWRGTLEAGALREFLGDVRWGALDLLLVDLPPGADGVADLAALVPDLAGTIVVTLPSPESERSVARALDAARTAGIRLLGIVENMRGYRCPDCGATHPLFPGEAGDALSDQFDIPVLARLSFSPSSDPLPGAGGGATEGKTMYAALTERLPES